jgi:anti-sigma regulatory factor (Ser/Thr protein kinase)
VILLEKLDLATRYATFRTLGSSRGQTLVVVDRLRTGLKQLGIDRLAVRFENGSSIEMPCDLPGDVLQSSVGGQSQGVAGAHSSPPGLLSLGMATETRAPDPGPHPSTSGERRRTIVHRFELENGKPTYEARFPHQLESLETIALYSGVALSTFGPLTGPLHFVRLALYELCANAIEHGRPFAPGVEIELGLSFDDGRVAGWIRDHCERFDPSANPLPTLAEHAAEGARRGYGLHMVHRILTTLTHDFDGTGNRLTFRKEIA